MLDDAKRREELADFLRTRRARLTPADVGLPAGAHRHTPGLRREEVAVLAGISEAWYTWLERARDIRPSAQVLDSIAHALRLDAEDRAYLHMLAQGDRPPEPPEETISPALQRMLDGFAAGPAFVSGRRTDILAWNEAADAIYDFTADPPEERNGLWRVFMNAHVRSMSSDWEHGARLMLSEFRATAARYPGDPAFAELIARLKAASPEFCAWWPEHDVHGRPAGRVELHHPQAGLLVLERMTLHVHDHPDLKVQVYTSLPEAGTPAKLQALVQARRCAAPA
jgi:transcriptional regulator with XRE-family HTH domain